MPWRSAEADGGFDPYKIWLSEIMLQQTQVARVIPKFEQFLKRFPDVQSLAAAPLADVLVLWSGLGYNRRAKYLHDAARRVVSDHNGKFPQSVAELSALPGVGKNTAGAILAYAHNEPVVFIETNIRSVLILYFFENQDSVTDAQLREVAQAVLDEKNPREWYWALMDYGSHLKSTAGNHARRAKSYVKQSKFEGSRRKVRGQVMRRLVDGPAELDALQNFVNDERLPLVLDALVGEQLVYFDGVNYRLPE